MFTEILFSFSFLPGADVGADASLVFTCRTLTLCCFHNLISTVPNLSEGADSVGGQLR